MKKGFTLSEVLITLGIIGVVSAMTIPTLVHKYKNDEYVASMKKAYSTLSQISPAVLHAEGLERFSSDTEYGGSLISQLKCISSGTGSNSMSLPQGVNNSALDTERWCRLADGFQINFRRIKAYTGFGTKSLYGWAFVDTNGTNKSPNLYGRDRWAFIITGDGRVFPSGARIYYPEDGSGETKYLNYSGSGATDAGINNAQYFTSCQEGYAGCGGHLLKNDWEMDY